MRLEYSGLTSVTWVCLVAGILASVVAGADAAPERYLIDPQNSRLEVFVRADPAGVAANLGTDQHVRVRRFDGVVIHDPDRLSASSVELRIESGSLEVLPGKSPADTLAEIQSTMESSQILDVRRFSTITFSSKSVTAVTGKEGMLTLGGPLTLHGKSREIKLSVTVKRTRDSLTVTGETVLGQTSFGIEPYSAMFGAFRLLDPVTVKFSIHASRDPSSKPASPVVAKSPTPAPTPRFIPSLRDPSKPAVFPKLDLSRLVRIRAGAAGVDERVELSDGPLRGRWSDSHGGLLEIAEKNGRLYFILQVVRGPAGHQGKITGSARWNEPLGWYSDEGLVPGKNGVSNLVFVLRGSKLEIVGAKTDYYHDARASFDGMYERVGKLSAADLERVEKAGAAGVTPEDP